MKKLILLLSIITPVWVWAQCNTNTTPGNTNATDCDCLDGSANCDLLPDITGSYDLLVEPGSLIESPGLVQLTVGTPNIGHGPLRVLPTDNYVCGTDTIYSPGGMDACPDGTQPHQIINQRIYHKSGDEMTYWDRQAGTMTYHPTHMHFHTDNWGNYTIRIPTPGEDNPLNWPIIGNGTKLGFCLMDLADCASPSSYGYCRDTSGTVITDDAANYGLGGGSYDCAISNQGISSGYLDIYSAYLTGMEIYFVPGVCNGDYKVVVDIDPNNNYIEENDSNNLIVADITLTEQPEDVDFSPITVSGDAVMCPGGSVQLSAPPVGESYEWSNGETTQIINVTMPGSYTCTVNRLCGPLYTDTIVVSTIAVEEPVTEATVEVCEGTSATLNATASGTAGWYDAAVGGTLLATGSSYTTPVLYTDQTYYIDNTTTTPIDYSKNIGEAEHEGTDYSTTAYNGYQVFDVSQNLTLESVTVFTDYAGVRIIELRDAADNVLQSAEVNIPSGTSTIDLNFDITAGYSYHLGTNDDANIALNDLLGEGLSINPLLKRNDAGTSYPYTISDVISVTGSSYDNSRWYYFYNWKLSYTQDFTCSSNRVPTEAKVITCTGISEVADFKNLSIYPNPSNGIFDISFETRAYDNLDINITNAFGEQVYTKSFGSVNGTFSTRIDMSSMAKGVYIVHIISDGKSVNKNIVLE